MIRNSLLVAAMCLVGTVQLMSCAAMTKGDKKLQNEAQIFIDSYTKTWQKLSTAAAEAEWSSNTYIVEGDSTNASATQAAMEALAAFTGSASNIKQTRVFLSRKDDLLPLQVKQLEIILYNAADNPGTVPDLVKRRIAAETKQTEKLFGFDFKINGKSVTTNEIDDVLRTSKDLSERLAAWEASKEVGKTLKDGLVTLRDLRNQTVQALGYKSYFEYQVSGYGMTVEEMLALLDRLSRELRPLYRQLHTYARYELAAKYGVKGVPDMIPAHWLPNRWGQEWSSMVEVEGFDLDSVLESKKPEWLIEQAERFYVSLGFGKLPESFWSKSSLYPAPSGANYKKNNHASAWHMDLQNDVRCLMSVIPNRDWYETTHHELGHIYYYQTYTNDDVPPLLREGANRAYHEAIGSQLGMAAMQRPFLSHLGLLPEDAQVNDNDILLQEALNHIVFIPFSTGTMTRFEHDLYDQNLDENEFNARWWELAARYQGIVPPGPRGEEFCDASSKTHINNDAAQYYDYALSVVLLFQLHDHIAREILDQDPRQTNYYGNQEVGRFLSEIMYPGASRDWRELLLDKVGSELSAEPMMRYFEPLMRVLEEKNKGRKHSLPNI